MKSGETKANINLRKTLRRKNKEKNRKFSEQKKQEKVDKYDIGHLK